MGLSPFYIITTDGQPYTSEDGETVFHTQEDLFRALAAMGDAATRRVDVHEIDLSARTTTPVSAAMADAWYGTPVDGRSGANVMLDDHYSGAKPHDLLDRHMDKAFDEMLRQAATERNAA